MPTLVHTGSRLHVSPTHRAVRLAYLTTLAALVLSGSAAAQRTLRVDSRPSCQRCTIEARLIATIEDTVEAGHFGSSMVLTSDSRGRLYGTDLSVNRWRIRVFDERGQLLRTLGREGSGPGEFRWAYPPLFGPGDTAVVVDPMLLRVTRLSPDYEYVASSQLPGGTYRRVLVTTSGQLVLQGEVRGASGTAPVHTIDRSGAVAASFGSASPTAAPTPAIESQRQLGAAADGDVWAAYVNRYVMQRWTPSGELRETVERDASWFPAWQQSGGLATAVRPVPMIQAVWQDESRRLWVVISVADSAWRRTEPAARAGREAAVSRAERHSTHDTIVEVIDLANGRLLASARFPLAYQTVGNGPPFTTYHEDDVGTPTYRVWRFELQQR